MIPKNLNKAFVQKIKMRKIAIVIAALLLALGVLIFQPVPISPEHKSNKITGTVSYIFEGGVNDVVFRLKDTNQRFYINRGLEAGLEMQKLKDELIGNEVTIIYPKYWTPLDPKNSTKHLTELRFNGDVIYSELGN